jgi:hypothetical protein
MRSSRLFLTLVLVLFASFAAPAARAGVQVTPAAQVHYFGTGFSSFDVEPFHGDPATLYDVFLVIESTSSTIHYSAVNGLDHPAEFSATGGWLPGYKHDLAEPSFSTGNYMYGDCGGPTIAPGALGSFHAGGTWAPDYTLEDCSSQYAPWSVANTPNNLHRVFVKSWDWAAFSPGAWENAQWGTRVRQSIHVEYYTTTPAATP